MPWLAQHKQDFELQRARQSVRCRLDGTLFLRRANLLPEQVSVFDISRHGCRIHIGSRLELDEMVFVRIDGLELLPAMVCWVRNWQAGLEFEKAMHPAVFTHLAGRLGAHCPPEG